MCTVIIRNLIAKIELDVIFSTRQFLSHGKRAAVDEALYRMVKGGEIIRLTPGIFVRKGSKWPSVKAIAMAKARAFGKELVRHAGDLAARFGLIEPLRDCIFDTRGSSSCFHSGEDTIYIKAAASRKMLLEETAFGQAIRAVWYKGRGDLELSCQSVLYQALQSLDRSQLPRLSALMPAWINDLIVG